MLFIKSMKKINTLCLVDDDNGFQFLTKRALEQTNMVGEVKVFSNGLEAINFLKDTVENKEELPEVILLDLNMPIMDGWEFVDEYLSLLPKLKKKIYLYIVSSSISQRDYEKAKSYSTITDYIVKPLTKDKFAEIIGGL